MPSLDAITAAVAMVKSPHIIKAAQAAPLPKGMTFLLEIAAQDSKALDEGTAATGIAPNDLEKAAAFFIEQVLLFRHADSYRVLGSHQAASDIELRRHMALIMKWLHPDIGAAASSAFAFDKTVYASRVTAAWENLKTAERRAAYDIQPRTQSHNGQKPHHVSATPSKSNGRRRGSRERRLAIYRLKIDSFWTRLRHRLSGRGL